MHLRTVEDNISQYSPQGYDTFADGQHERKPTDEFVLHVVERGISLFFPKVQLKFNRQGKISKSQPKVRMGKTRTCTGLHLNRQVNHTFFGQPLYRQKCRVSGPILAKLFFRGHRRAICLFPYGTRPVVQCRSMRLPQVRQTMGNFTIWHMRPPKAYIRAGP